MTLTRVDHGLELRRGEARRRGLEDSKREIRDVGRIGTNHCAEARRLNEWRGVLRERHHGRHAFVPNERWECARPHFVRQVRLK